MSLLAKYLMNRWVIVALGITLLQQAIVATGTYLMGSLAQNASRGTLSISELSALVLCISLPGTVFHYWIRTFHTLGLKAALKKYFDLFIRNFQGRIDLWRNAEQKQQSQGALTKVGQDTLTSTSHFLDDVWATSLNILFNTVSVVLVTDVKLGVVILAAGLLGLWLVHLGNDSIQESARCELETENALNTILQRSWDSVLIGNSDTLRIFSNRFEWAFQNSRKASLQALKKNQGRVAIAGLLTHFGVMFTVAALAWRARSEPAQLVSLLVMLPRCLQLVFHVQIIQSYWAQWKSLRQRLEILKKGLDAPLESELLKHVSSKKIRVSTVETEGRAYSLSVEDFIALSENLNVGRFRVDGVNGAGKSTFLMHLKKGLGAKAYYLPAHHQLESTTTESLQHFSTGEKTLHFRAALVQDTPRVLLLDEWDANLSHRNRERIDQQLSTLAQTSLVIEVRHRTDPLNLKTLAPIS